jgi:hypothetical protein
MSEPTEATQSAPAPVAADTATATAPVAPAKADDKNPAWLPERIEQAKRSAMAETLKALGVADVESAKVAIAKARELEEASKSEIQKLADRLASVEPQATRARDLEERLSRFADAELSKLSENQRAAVMRIAGDDKARALDTIEALRPTWSSQSQSAPSAPLPAPASTAQQAPPTPAKPSNGIDHRATYEALKAQNPVMAAAYRQQHQHALTTK